MKCSLGFQVAEIIKEDLWPNPLSYFNNVCFFLLLSSQAEIVIYWCFLHGNFLKQLLYYDLQDVDEDELEEEESNEEVKFFFLRGW